MKYRVTVFSKGGNIVYRTGLISQDTAQKVSDWFLGLSNCKFTTLITHPKD